MRKAAKKPAKRAGNSKTAAQQRYALFVKAYIANGGNGKQAAISAGYAPKNAEVTASKLLRLVKVRDAIDAHAKAAAARYDLTIENVLRETARIAYFDPAHCYDESGVLLHPKDMPEDTRRAVASMETVEAKDADGNVYEYTKKLRAWDKNAALERAFKHFGLYKADNEQRDAAPRFFYVPAKGPVREAHEAGKGLKRAPNQHG
jgi:phage terminase small subunit